MQIPSLQIGEHRAEVPIIQGGMGIGVSLHRLAAAVANTGGIGVIAVASIGFIKENFRKNPRQANIEALKEEIAKARKLAPDGVIGVNIMVALTDYEAMVRTALEAKADIIFSGAGLPLNLPKIKQEYPDSKTALAPIVSSPRAAALLCKKWRRYGYLPDAFVLEGSKAGGHLGFSMEELLNDRISIHGLLRQTVESVAPFAAEAGGKIPVITGGGVYTGADIAEMLANGAAGAQMATRFVVTEECDAAIEFKQEYIRAKKQDIVFIKSPVGLPGRAIKNEFLHLVEQGKKTPFKCPYHCIKTCIPKQAPYCISLALINAQRGNLNEGFAFAGANAYRADKIVPVKSLMDELSTGLAKAQGPKVVPLHSKSRVKSEQPEHEEKIPETSRTNP